MRGAVFEAIGLQDNDGIDSIFSGGALVHR